MNYLCWIFPFNKKLKTRIENLNLPEGKWPRWNLLSGVNDHAEAISARSLTPWKSINTLFKETVCMAF
jgi:hypothetical protein